MPLLLLGGAGGVSILVGGVDRRSLVLEGSLRWTNRLNARDTLEITFRDHIPSDMNGGLPLLFSGQGQEGFVPIDGHPIRVLHDGVVVFGGILTEPAESVDGDSSLMRYECSAEDYSALAERHFVAAVYENMTLRAIVLDIVATALAGEGINTDGVETGPTITKAVFPYVTALQAFNDLSELSGLTWRIDADKALKFCPRTDEVAPQPITDTSYVKMTVRATREQYRNVQTVRAGTELTVSRSENFKGDGTRKVFNVAFPVGLVPSSITVNAVGKTIGIRQVDTGKDFYWNKNSTEISQDDGAAALTAADTLVVTYRGLYPIIVQSRDEGEIGRRAAIENGQTGVYEHVEDRPQIDSGDMALETAGALIQRHGRITKVIDVEVLTPGFRAGHLVTITNTKHRLDGQFLIESVEAYEWTGVDGNGNPQLMYHLRALEGDMEGGWMAFFRKLLLAGRQFVIRENEVLLLLRSVSDTINISDDLEVTAGAPESRVGFAIVGFSEAA